MTIVVVKWSATPAPQTSSQVADTPTGYTLKDIQAQLDVLAIVGAAAGG